MRILHCSDLHANLGWYEWLVRAAVDYDLVCLTGDLLDLNPRRPPNECLARVTHQLRRLRQPLALCSGNHDIYPDDPRLADAAWLHDLRGPQVWVDGDQFDFGGHHFRCIPWMAPLEPAKSDREIWLIHAPPDCCPTGISVGGVGFGDFEFGELCRTGLGPRLALGGHVHAPQAWHARVNATTSINAGCDFQSTIPRSTVVDLGRNEVTFGDSVIRF